MSETVIGFDTETDIISPSNKTPQLVCLTLAGGPDSAAVAAHLRSLESARVWRTGKGWEALVGADCALEAYLVCREEGATLVAHNMPFDVGVLANHVQDIRDTETVNPFLADAIADVEAGRLRDTRVAEQLICIATDNFQFDKRCGRPFKNTFSLAQAVKVYQGIDLSEDKTKLADLQKKGVSRDQWPWRYRYIDLLDKPVHLWPRDARDYAVMDAQYAREVYLAQRGRNLKVDGHPVVLDGVVTNEIPQTAAALALHFMACEGVPVSADTVDLFEQDIDALVAQYDEACRALGVVRINRCKTCGDNGGGTGYVGTFPNLRVCPHCGGKDHETCMAEGVYKNRKAQAGIGKLYTKRLVEIVRWGYHGDPPMTERPKNQSPAAYKKWAPSVKTDEETLLAINHPMVQQYVTGKKATKWRGTYLPPLQEALADGGRVCPGFNVLVRSGRTSSFAPNLQNPPRRGRFRECFVPPEDWVMSSVDYATLELAALAQSCLTFFGESRMAELINQGVDLHAWFGSKLKGISPELFLERLGAGDPECKALRQLAKVPNFGLPGGLGPKGLVKYALGYGVFLEIDQPTTTDGVTLPSARDLCRQWKAAFPEMPSYFSMLAHESDLSADGLFNIKQLVSGRVRGGATYTSGANSYFQGLAADGAKNAMWQLFKATYTDTSSPLFGCRLWNFIHDEFLLMGPRETSHLWAPEVSRIMVAAMREVIPDVAIAAPPALAERWYKSMEPVYTEDGTLLPWAPLTDLPEGVTPPDGLSKNQRVLFASGYLDALAQGADPDEAHEEGLHLAHTGRLG